MIQFYAFNSLDISSPLRNAIALSMKVNTQGYPHLAWVANHNGHYVVYYSFWDGLQWSDAGDVTVYKATDTIVPCEQMLSSSADLPMVVFMRTSHLTNYLCVASYTTQWDVVEAALNGTVAWYTQIDGNKICVLDTDGLLSFYTLSGTTLTLASSSNVLNGYAGRTIIKTKSAVFTDGGVDYLGVACLLDTEETILVNNVKLSDGTWAATPWGAISGTHITDISVCAASSWFVGWLQHDNGITRVRLQNISTTNTISDYYTNTTVDTARHTVNSQQFIAGYPRTLSLCYDSGGIRPIKILLCGAQHRLLEVSPDSLTRFSLSIYGSGYDCIPQCVQSQSNLETIVYAYISNGAVCCVSGNTTYTLECPSYDATVLTSRRAKYVAMRGAAWSTYNEIPCAWNARNGDVLHESYRRFAVLMADTANDPLCILQQSSDSSSVNSGVSGEGGSSYSSDRDDNVCDMLVSASGGNEGYEKTFVLPEPWSGGSCPPGYKWGLHARFKTYVVPDSLTIVFYDSDDVWLGYMASGCIATDTLPGGWWESTQEIPIGTLKVMVQVAPNCTGTSYTRWVLETSCECFIPSTSSLSSLTSQTSDSSLLLHL